MMEIDELATATNWTGIYQGRDSLIVKFDERDAHKIVGLGRNDDTFFLKFPEYQREPVAFLVTRGPHEMYYYAVLGERLSRPDAPAKITYDFANRIATQEFFHHGLLHNDMGPARINIWGHATSEVHPRTQEEIPGYLIEEWDGLEAEWFEFGERARYPMPFSILCENGCRLFRTAGGDNFLNDAGDLPGFSAGKLTGNWAREHDKLTDDSFRLRFLQVTGYHRNYTEGEPVEQSAESMDRLVWIVNGNIVEINNPSDRDKARRDMFPYWNIWDGPLFPNAQELMISMNMVK